MQTVQWLNLNRNVTVASELLGLAVVTTIAVPALVLVGLSGIFINTFTKR